MYNDNGTAGTHVDYSMGSVKHGTRPLRGIGCQDPPSFPHSPHCFCFLHSPGSYSASCCPLASEGHFPRLCFLPLLSAFCLLLPCDLPWQYFINPIFLNQSYLTPNPKSVCFPYSWNYWGTQTRLMGPALPLALTHTFNPPPTESASGPSSLGVLLQPCFLTSCLNGGSTFWAPPAATFGPSRSGHCFPHALWLLAFQDLFGGHELQRQEPCPFYFCVPNDKQTT